MKSGSDENRLRATLRELDTLIVTRLFRSQRWFPDPDTNAALDRKLTQMRLQERDREDPRTIITTTLGAECDLGLLMIFMGHWSEYDIAELLEDYGFIDECERILLWDLLSAGIDPECVLRKRVQQAYHTYHNATRIAQLMMTRLRPGPTTKQQRRSKPR
jgi:hypothetical protein